MHETKTHKIRKFFFQRRFLERTLQVEKELSNDIRLSEKEVILPCKIMLTFIHENVHKEERK